MALEHITDFVARTASRVLSQYKPLARFGIIISGIAGRVQDAEDALWAIVAQLNVDTAQGVWLDYLGAFVGEARDGANDAAYRVFIAARILANRSQGTVEEILSVINTVMAGAAPILLVRRLSPASLEVRIEDSATGLVEPNRTRLMKILRSTRAAGVRLMVLYWPDQNDDQLFTFSSDDTLQLDADKGFGDDMNPLVGGKFIDADAP